MQTKKLLSCFILSFILSLGLGVICHAAGVTVNIGSAKASPGQQFSVDLSVDNVPSDGISSMDFSIQYDKNVIELTEVKPVGEIEGTDVVSPLFGVPDFEANIDNGNGLVSITFLTFEPSSYAKSSGAIINLKGNVLPTASDKASCDLEIIPTPRETSQGSGTPNTSIIIGDAMSRTEYDVTASSGKVTVDSTTTDNLCVAISKASAATGSKFNIDVSLLNVPDGGIGYMDFAIKYDKNLIEINSAKPVGKLEGSDVGEIPDFGWEIDNINGYINIFWVPMDPSSVITNDGTFFAISGTVLSSDPNAVSEFSIVPVDRETYPGSGVKNDEIIFADLLTGANYNPTYNTGLVTVISKGDVDKDGDVDNTDASIVLRYVSSIDKVFDTARYDMAQADCDGANGIDMLDVIWIMNHKRSSSASTTESTTETTTTETTTETTTDSQTGSVTHEKTFADGLSSDFFTISGNTSNSKGSVTYNGNTLTHCLKMETNTSITFTAKKAGTLTLVFGGSTSANGKEIKIDGANQTITSNGTNEVLTMNLEAGAHTIAKKDSINMFYMSFAEK